MSHLIYPKDVEAILATNTAARNARLELEREIASDPYTDHLYQEQQFEQLIFLELRKQTLLLESIMHELISTRLTLITQEATLNEDSIHGAYKLSDLMYEHNEGPIEKSGEVPEETLKDELTVIHADNPDGTQLTPKKTAKKKPGRKPVRRIA